MSGSTDNGGTRKLVWVLAAVIVSLLGGAFSYWVGRVEGTERALNVHVKEAVEIQGALDKRLTRQEDRYADILAALQEIRKAQTQAGR